jgi:TolB-like protein/Tfp pilus assembly protein PilF
MSSEPRAVYRFDRFTLDLVRGGLFAEDGSQLALRPKSLDLLCYMVTHAGQLVDRDELMQAVWPNVFVTDDSIAQCIRDIRRALGDQTQRLVRTVQRRGYLLDVATARVSADVAAAPTKGSSVDAAMPMPAPAANRPMLVVLPFENIGDDPAQSYLAAGMTADLVTDLTHFEALHVVSPPGPARNSGVSATAAAAWSIPPEASYLFAGSVRREQARIRITIRLDDARTGVSLWAERFDRPLDQLMALQEEMVERLPAHLVTHIEREATQRSRRRPTNSLDAYDFYLRGRELHLRGTETDTLAAREMFAQAIALDPDYAAAYAWQANTVQRGYSHLWGETRGKAAAIEALTLARRAVELDPGSSLCLGMLGFVLLVNREWDEALEMGRMAVRANPCAPQARYHHGEVLMHAGDPAEAEPELRLVMALDPFYPPVVRAALGRALFATHRLAEAFAELRYCADRLPDHTLCLQTLAAAAAEAGRLDEARAAVAALLRTHPGLTVESAVGSLFFRDSAMIERFLAGFRAGGMPES